MQFSVTLPLHIQCPVLKQLYSFLKLNAHLKQQIMMHFCILIFMTL